MSTQKEITQQDPTESIYSKIYSFFLLEDLQKDDVKAKKSYLISKEDLKKLYDCIKYDSLKELKTKKEKEFNQKSIEDYYKENKIELKPLDKDAKIKIKEKTEKKEENEKMEKISEIVVEILQNIGYIIENEKKEEQTKQDEIKENNTEPSKEISKDQTNIESKDVNKTKEQIKKEKEVEKEKKDKEQTKETAEEKGDKTNKEEEKEKTNQDQEDKDKENDKKEGDEKSNIEKGAKEKKEEEEKSKKEEQEEKLKKEQEEKLKKGQEEAKPKEKEKEKEGNKEDAQKPEEKNEEIKNEDDKKLSNTKDEPKPGEESNNAPKDEGKNDEPINEINKSEEEIKQNEFNIKVEEKKEEEKKEEEKKEEEKKEPQENNNQNIPSESNPIQTVKVEPSNNLNDDPPKQENCQTKEEKASEEKNEENKNESPKKEEKEEKPKIVEDNTNVDPKHEQPEKADTLNIDENKEENENKINDNKECIKGNNIIINKENQKIDILNLESGNKDKNLLGEKVNRSIDGEQNEQESNSKRKKTEEKHKQEEVNEIKNPEEKKEEKIEKNEIKNPEEEQEQNENNQNNIVNQLTPEQIQQLQQMQQQFIMQKHLMDNGWENNFLNNYLFMIPNNKEIDYDLPQVKNGLVQLESDKPSLGLQNVGATCYMNATLECLIHIKELSQLLLSAFSFKYPKEDQNYAAKHKLTLTYVNLLSQVFFPKINGNQSKYYAPYEFKNIISEINPLFQGVQANDAKDLLQCILENLHNELKMATQYFQEYDIDQRDEKASMGYFFNSYLSQNKSPILDYLYGINRIKSICLNCNTAKYNFQSYNLLYFPLKEAKRIALLRKKKENENFDEKNYILNLEDCFAHSEQVDHFTGDNQMYCNECQSSADAEYQTVLYTTPTIISIVLNRGKANLDFQEKFEFGLDLDIKKYIYSPNFKHGKYYLIGMVVHSGEHGMGGHFIAYCRMEKKAKWFCYNDAWVTECNDIEKKLTENSPYILFYHYDNDYDNEEIQK